jgi:hypothetical protein
MEFNGEKIEEKFEGVCEFCSRFWSTPERQKEKCTDCTPSNFKVMRG